MLDRKIWKFFRPRGKGRKRAKCDQFFCPTSDFFDFYTPSFIIPLPLVWILLTKPMQKSVTTVCLHCSFARLKNKHIGVLATYIAPQCLGIPEPMVWDVSLNLVPIVTQSHTGLHEKQTQNSSHQLAKLSSQFSAFRKCLK